ncbi:MAG: hypothetical protein KAI99_15430 [Cyclobacteriaceae bacterium]|nr:hypothetical protein [Cyclobacteriaceae bacterium]MCK5469912.1 hypothetical protein [Cyclobacteriaceae bacterium]
MAIKVFGIICLFIWFLSEPNIKNRQLEYNGSTVMTTFEIEDKFYGKYKGRKSGFLLLNNDGSGIYRYDYPEMSPECYGENIEFIWGFIVDDNGEIVKFKRSYGYSYPIIYNCTGENAFQGCTRRAMVDYVLEYDNGTITISSSDDWEKTD